MSHENGCEIERPNRDVKVMVSYRIEKIDNANRYYLVVIIDFLFFGRKHVRLDNYKFCA